VHVLVAFHEHLNELVVFLDEGTVDWLNCSKVAVGLNARSGLCFFFE